jgi:hypothetical protein
MECSAPFAFQILPRMSTVDVAMAGAALGARTASGLGTVMGWFIASLLR